MFDRYDQGASNEVHIILTRRLEKFLWCLKGVMQTFAGGVFTTYFGENINFLEIITKSLHHTFEAPEKNFEVPCDHDIHLIQCV